MTDIPGPISKRCPKCNQVDITDFSDCRFCGTRYDWVRPQKHFDAGAFIRSPISVIILLYFLARGVDMLAQAGIKHLASDARNTIAATTNTLKQDPNNYDALVKRGYAYYVLGKWDMAVNDYTAAIAVQPRLAEAYRKRADAYDAMSNSDTARKDRETAASLSH